MDSCYYGWNTSVVVNENHLKVWFQAIRLSGNGWGVSVRTWLKLNYIGVMTSWVKLRIYVICTVIVIGWPWLTIAKSSWLQEPTCLGCILRVDALLMWFQKCCRSTWTWSHHGDANGSPQNQWNPSGMGSGSVWKKMFPNLGMCISNGRVYLLIPPEISKV